MVESLAHLLLYFRCIIMDLLPLLLQRGPSRWLSVEVCGTRFG